MRRFLVLVTAAAVTLAGTGVAAASTVVSTDDLVQTETLPVLTQSVTGTQSALQQEYCDFAAPTAHRLSTSVALAKAGAYLDKHSSRAARRAFARSRFAKSEQLAIAAGANALAASSSTAALDALLRAHTLAPKDPRPLADMAPVLTDLKLPNEALAVLRAAASLKPPKHNPWGIPLSATIANNQGYALLALKHWSAAATALAHATSISKDLSEAELNMAEADLCQGKSAAAARMIFFGVRRSPSIAGDLVEGGTGVPNPTQVGIDASHGASITLPTYRYPATISDGAAMFSGFNKVVSDLESAEPALSQQQRDLQTELYNQLQTANPPTRRRVNDLVTLAANAVTDPTVAPLDNNRQQLWDESHNYATTLMGQTIDCSGGQSTHTAWVTVIKQLDTATRKDISAEYKLATSVGAYVQQPAAHQLIQVDASLLAQELLVLLVQQAQTLTIWDEACASTIPGPINPVVKDTDTRDNSAKCPSGLVGKSWSFDLGPVNASIDCDSVSFEVGTDGWIGLFANVSHNFRDGSTTIFGGPKFTANAGSGWGPNVTFKDGLYLTIDSSGAPQSLGARVETGSGIDLGPAGGVSFNGDSMDFSFAGASPIGTSYAF